MAKVAESSLRKIEKDHFDGITSAALLAFFAEQNIRFGEATLRKWVQLGLLPRSVRVGQKGKHQGSKGKYPVRVVRRILHIKELMAKNLTIEEIQEQFLFVRGDIEELEQTLDKIFKTLERRVADKKRLSADLTKARALAADLLERLGRAERRLMAEAEAARSEAAAS